MKWTKDQLRAIHDRTSGKCHVCCKQLAFKNYGRFGERGAWEVEHSVARVRGGSDRLSNLYAACISCNRAKRDSSTRTARRLHDRSKAPLSRERRTEAKRTNAFAGGVLGTVIGGVLLGPPGAALGALVGATLGRDQDPDEVQ